jgi:phosphotransferase system  glucose/maltose/N-acetylglucosamine-specific IIC component
MKRSEIAHYMRYTNKLITSSILNDISAIFMILRTLNKDCLNWMDLKHVLNTIFSNPFYFLNLLLAFG